MPDIGQALREARTRKRVDMSQVESATKIRAKYLRALENEEWDALPGPTYVKTFLRTYAEYLGLDARSLVEEYKLRYERPFAADLTPFGMRPALRQRRRRRVGPWLALLAVVIAVGAGLWWLGRDPAGRSDTATGERPAATASPGDDGGAGDGSVALRIVATRTTRVCVLDARGRTLLSRRRLPAGRSTATLRGARFRIGFDGGRARMRIDGRGFPVDARARMVGFDVRPDTPPRRLPRRRVPDCR
jgi:transcriptional regulator with XRE-family HTH domain